MIVPLLQTTANRWRLLSPVSLPISRVPWCPQLFTLLILKCQQNDSIMRDARGAVCRVSNQLETSYLSPHTRLEGVPSNKFERASSKQASSIFYNIIALPSLLSAVIPYVFCRICYCSAKRPGAWVSDCRPRGKRMVVQIWAFIFIHRCSCSNS